MRKIKKALASLAIAGMVLSMAPASIFAADDNRLAGDNRYQTAIAVAEAAYSEATTAVVAAGNQENLVDALAAAPLAAQKDAPIYLTDKGNMNDDVINSMMDLGVENVIVVGAAANDAVVKELENVGFAVEKLAGQGRVETANAINAELEDVQGKFLVGHMAIADAMSVASYAAANNYAIVVADNKGNVPAGVSGIDYVVGGSAVVKSVAGADRISGDDRWGTNKAVLETLDFDYDKVYLAKGLDANLSDALVASVLAALDNAPIVLTNGTTIAAKDVVVENMTSKSEVIALGGSALVSNALRDSLKPEVAAELKIESVSAIGAKKIEVVFNNSVDAKKAEVSLKKGTVAVNIDEIEFAENAKSAIIETTTKLTKTDEKTLYAVTVAGLTEEALMATVAVKDEIVDKIEVTTTTAPMDALDKSKATFAYKVLNQYGENVTKDYTNISWTASTGWTSPTGNANGQMTFVNAGTPANDFIPGAKVHVTGVYANTSNGNSAVVNAEFAIGLESKADKVVFEDIYQASKKKFDANFKDADNFRLLYKVLDQYGNEMPVAGTPAVVFTNNNPLLLNVPQNATATAQEVDGEDYFTLQLTRADYTAKGGSAKIIAISQTTGTQSTYEINLEALAVVKTFTMSAPAEIVSKGETVEIPFTALDQNGNAVTKYTDLNGKLTLSTELSFEEDAKGDAKLTFTPGDKGLRTITTLVKDGGSFSSLTIDVKDVALAKVIIGLDSKKSTNVVKDGELKIKPADLKYQDQYGRVIDNENLSFGTDTFVGYRTTINGTVSSWTPLTTEVDLYNEKLTKIEFALFEEVALTTLIQSSNKVFNVTVSDQSKFVSYEVADPGVIYNDGKKDDATNSKYNKTLKVYGVKEDGTKVLLTASYYTVTTASSSKLDVSAAGVIADKSTGGYEADDFKDKDKNSINKTEKLTITIKDVDITGAIKEVLTKEITLSNAAPKGETVKMEDGIVNGRYQVANSGGNVALNSLEAIAIKEVKDQYGVEMDAAGIPVIKNVTKVDDSSFSIAGGTITGAKAGDKFTAEFKYGSKVVSVDFIVK